MIRTPLLGARATSRRPLRLSFTRTIFTRRRVAVKRAVPSVLPPRSRRTVPLHRRVATQRSRSTARPSVTLAVVADEPDPLATADHDVAPAHVIAPIDPREIEAGAAVDLIGSLVARADHVVALAAGQPVRAVGPSDPVVTVVAVERAGDQTGQPVRAGDPVVAGARIEHELFGRADVEVERAGRGGAGAVERDPPGGCRGLDGELLAAAAAVDLDRVVAGAAFVDVVAVAGVPDQRVVAVAADGVVARAGGRCCRR